MKLENVKGTKDYGPEEMLVRQYIIETLEEVFRNYGFNQTETPVLEKMDILAAKYAGGDEILKETYSLEDQGGRKLGLRYDMTVPLARFVGMNPTIKIPFKRYQIGPVFRDGPVRTGRLRQFFQADADIIGCQDVNAEIELLNLALDAFDRLSLDVNIKVNSRKVLDALMEKTGIQKEKREDAILSLDKYEKIGREEVVKEMVSKGIDKENADALLDLIEGASENILNEFSGNSGVKDIRKIIDYAGERVKFTPSLARGLAYYNGAVFEVFSVKGKVKSSLAAGGRYDNMIKNLTEKADYPAVGISFGVEPIFEQIKDSADIQTTIQILIIPIGIEKEARELASRLRKDKINTDIDLMNRGISKNLKYADSYGIPYCIFIGENEIKKGKYKLKNMESGEEEDLDYDGLKNTLQNNSK